MNIIYDNLSKLVPYKTCIKEKKNDDLLIVFNINSEILYLNEVSRDFYELCDGNNSISVIISKLMEIYDVSLQQLEEDIVSLIRDMQWDNILGLKEIMNNEKV